MAPHCKRRLSTPRDEGSPRAATTAYFADGRTILTAATDGTTVLWDLRLGIQLAKLTETGPMAAAASHDGRWFLTGSSQGGACLWETSRVLNETAPEPSRHLQGHTQNVSAVAFSPDGESLFTGDRGGRFFRWDRASGNPVHEIKGHTDVITAGFFLPDGNRLITASLDKTVAQWDVKTGRELSNLRVPHPDSVTTAALSHDGRRLLTVCPEGRGRRNSRIRLWDIDNREQRPLELKAMLLNGEAVTSLAFAPDGGHAVSTSSAGEIRFWDLQTGQSTGSLQQREVAAAVYSADAAHVLSAGGGEAVVWDVTLQERAVRFRPHFAVASAGFSWDGKYVVTGGHDATARIWQAETGRSAFNLFPQGIRERSTAPSFRPLKAPTDS
jgi:WD40 repeat protein